MSSYLLSVSGKKDIVKMKITKSYTLNQKTNTYRGIKLKEVTIYDEDKIQDIIIHNYKIKYQRILQIIHDLSSTDNASESDYMICLDEVEKLKAILNFKYQKFLKKEVYEYFLDKLLFFEKILNEKIIEYRESMLLSEGMGR